MALSFDEWMNRVNLIIHRKCGLTANDIDDWRYYEEYNKGLSASKSAENALINAGWASVIF